MDDRDQETGAPAEEPDRDAAPESQNGDRSKGLSIAGALREALSRQRRSGPSRGDDGRAEDTGDDDEVADGASPAPAAASPEAVLMESAAPAAGDGGGDGGGDGAPRDPGGARRGAGARKDRLAPIRPLLDRFAATAAGSWVHWLRRKLALRRSLRVQIAFSLGTAVAFTLLASVVALVAFFQVGSVQREINTEYVPALTNAVEIGRLAAELAGTAPRLVVASQSGALAPDDAAATGAETELDLMDRAARLIELSTGLAESERTVQLRQFSEDLAGNLRDIQASVDVSSGLQARLDALQASATELARALNDVVAPLIDEQHFYMVHGVRSLDDVPVSVLVRGSDTEVARFRDLSAIESRGGIAAGLLVEAVVQDDAVLIGTLEERFLAATAGADRALAGLGANVPAALTTTVRAIRELGTGEEGAFALRGAFLTELVNQQAYLARNIAITESLNDAVSALTVGLDMDAIRATQASERALNLGRSLLLALNVLAIGCTALILWLFVGRFLIARLTKLSAAMRRMADGDLNTRVEVRGEDEVGEMAEALEVFRRHALEVQRLNLVEQLAKRVEAQNEELERTLDDLRRAQDQMVMQEKLASLGQLTAGIAHEIKNPLNFVNNFAQISRGLLSDLEEELNDAGDALSDDAKEEITEISRDLSGNLERITHHGKRASSIVYGMLEHARKEGGESRPTEINAMLEEFIALAFHSMRAVDNTFQMTIEKDLADDVGEVEGIPQDLSRVFLNIVTNACQATLEKQKTQGGRDAYQPCLQVRSRRENGKVEVRIRDNGPGIPEKHLKKIFEPFFTTKDTDKGTGLGLSLSHDIVRRHGGSLAVASEPGQGAEFVVTLPVSQP